MQTFLPYPRFADSAKVLDYRRLGKQRVEAKQILIALGVAVGGHAGNAGSRWRRHPAVLMWKGFEHSLVEYSIEICREWRRRGFKDTLLEQFERVPSHGCEPFHESHRSNLLRKDAEYYGRFGWATPHDLPYVWPPQGSANNDGVDYRRLPWTPTAGLLGDLHPSAQEDAARAGRVAV